MSRAPNGKFKAQIGFKKQRFHIGTFDTFKAAVQARLEVEELIHGGFVTAFRQWSAYAEKYPQWAQENPLVFEVVQDEGDITVVKSHIPVLNDTGTENSGNHYQHR